MLTLMKSKDNFWQADVHALVNPVNTEGNMSQGISAEFKKRYPEMYREYRIKCRIGELKIGTLHIFPVYSKNNPKYIINFPIATLFRNPPELSHIQSGMDPLARMILDHKIRSLAIPPLGCGVDGLNFDDVLPILRKIGYLIRQVEFIVYPPPKVKKEKKEK